MSETWIIKSTAPDGLDTDGSGLSANFTSNNTEFVKLKSSSRGVERPNHTIYVYLSLHYIDSAGNDVTVSPEILVRMGNTILHTRWKFINEAYRVLTFDTAPTGNALRWLQTYADKQDTEYLTRQSELTSVANAIREKSGTTEQLIYPDGFVSAVAGIKKAPTGAYMDVLEYVEETDTDSDVSHYIKRAKLYNHTRISAHEFDGQADLQELDCSDPSNHITAIEAYAFAGSSLDGVVLPDTLTSLGIYCFTGARMGTLTIPPLVTILPQGVFAYAKSSADSEAGEETQVNIIFPQNLVKIGQRCFESAQIKQITIPDTVTEIGDSAFAYNNHLTSISLPPLLQKISNNMFDQCASLTNITIPASVTEIGNAAFAATGITHITIPESVTALGGYVLSGCLSLTNIDIQAKVTEIPEQFAAETGRTSVTLPDTVQTIGAAAFATGSASLTEITIPASVTSIGTAAFAQSNPMTTITCLATTPPILNGYDVFQIDSNTVIKVPSASVAAYKAATNWSDYADQIVGI